MNDENEGAFGSTADREAVEQIEPSESESVDSKTTEDLKSGGLAFASQGGEGTGFELGAP